MGWFGKLFSSSEVVKDITSGISNGIDKSFYTDEEKADSFHKMLALYTPFKIAQRILAITFCIPYALAWFIMFLASFIYPLSQTQLSILNGDIGTIVITIVLFYFGGGALEGAIEKFKSSKPSSNSK